MGELEKERYTSVKREEVLGPVLWMGGTYEKVTATVARSTERSNDGTLAPWAYGRTKFEMKEEDPSPLVIITRLISLPKSIIVSLTFVARLDYRANCHLPNFDNSRNFHKFALEIVADTIPIPNVLNLRLIKFKVALSSFHPSIYLSFSSLTKKTRLLFYAIHNF